MTSLELALHPVGPTVLGGVVFYAGEDAAEVVAGWRDHVADAPDELSSLVNLTTAPPAPFLPDRVALQEGRRHRRLLGRRSGGGRRRGQAPPHARHRGGRPASGRCRTSSCNSCSTACGPRARRTTSRPPSSTAFPTTPSPPSPTSIAAPPTFRCRPSSTCTTSVAPWLVSLPTPRRSPIARRRTSSTASLGRLMPRTSRPTASGPRRHGEPWPATAPGAPT